MHQNHSASRQQRVRRALLRLALVVLPATLIAHATKSAGHIASPAGLRPYLRVVYPPPLRFHAPAEPPALAASSALPADDPVAALPPVETSAPAVLPPPAAGPADAVTETMPEPTATTKPASTPAPIFTDKNEPHVRIEDIMTFFEPPGTRLPTGQPPSAATYQQQ